MTIEISRNAYAVAEEVTARYWPHHNREQGIRWETTTGGLVATDARRAVGAATFKLVGGVALLEQLVVASDETRKGIGTLLLLEFERVARESDCHLMELETAETQARPFYEKHGFVVTASRPNGKFDLTWFLMEKRITGSTLPPPKIAHEREA